MKNKQATRKDVATLAGVSETIVSYVVNNNRYVSKEKKKRVQEAIKELRYRPNTIARALKGMRTNHLLFIADSLDNEHFGKTVQEIDEIAYSQGFIISMMRSRNSLEFVNRIIYRQVDGIIIASSKFEEKYIVQLIDASIPVVLFMNHDYLFVSNKAGRIYTGIEEGIKNGVKYLVNKGYKNIVHVDRISHSNNFSNMSDLRYRGFCMQMQAEGLPLTERSILAGCTSEEDLYNSVLQLIKSKVPVDAFICRNDHLAIITMSAIEKLGLKVPDDIAVMGFDNSSVSTTIRPQLTSISINRKEIAKAAFDILNGMLEGKEPSTANLKTTLIERESTLKNKTKQL